MSNWTKSIETLHIGEMLYKHIRQHRYFQSVLARDLGISQKSVWQYKKRKTMRVDTLLNLCQSLNYNFLRDIAALLPADMPPHHAHPLQTRLAELEQQNHELQLQVKTLQEALRLVGSK